MVPCRTQQDCVVEQRLEHKSELLAVTTSLDFHWYSVSESAVQHDSSPDRPPQQEELPVGLRVELLAVLKKTELCTKLRKLDFRKYWIVRQGQALNLCRGLVIVFGCHARLSIVRS